MKNKYILGALLICITSLFTACTDDNDSNPTLIQPTEFVLNAPAYANETVDLQHAADVAFTWSQPKYTADAEKSYTRCRLLYAAYRYSDDRHIFCNVFHERNGKYIPAARSESH